MSEVESLAARVDESWERADEPAAIDAEAVEETIGLLDRGVVRVAEPDGDGWHVHQWAKKAVLLYFRIRGLEQTQAGPFEYHDKLPLKHGYDALGVRVVPPATARYGSFLSPGVVLMPSYVNIGAWVGPDTMVDTWATVGSCAQIGAACISRAGSGIGGVLEPLQAAPVVVEDGAFVGSRCIVVEGVRVGANAVLGAGRRAHGEHARDRRDRAASRSSIVASCRPDRSSSPATGRASSRRATSVFPADSIIGHRTRGDRRQGAAERDAPRLRLLDGVMMR